MQLILDKLLCVEDSYKVSNYLSIWTADNCDDLKV